MTYGRRATGADFTANAVGRWACNGTDFVVAKGPQGLLLHDLDMDIVDEAPKSSGDATLFAVSDGVVTKQFLVPADPTAPARVRVTIGSFSGKMVGLQRQGSGPGMNQFEVTVGSSEDTSSRTCPAAPKVVLW